MWAAAQTAPFHHPARPLPERASGLLPDRSQDAATSHSHVRHLTPGTGWLSVFATTSIVARSVLGLAGKPVMLAMEHRFTDREGLVMGTGARFLTFILSLVLGAAVLPGVLQAEPKKGGTLIMAMDTEPPTLASYTSTAQPVGEIATKIYEGLLDYTPDLKPIPGLAKSWTVSPDGKTITFTLRNGVKCHDGKPFTSADVKYTFIEVLKKLHPRGINTFREVEAIDTPDDHTAVFKLAPARALHDDGAARATNRR